MRAMSPGITLDLAPNLARFINPATYQNVGINLNQHH